MLPQYGPMTLRKRAGIVLEVHDNFSALEPIYQNSSVPVHLLAGLRVGIVRSASDPELDPSCLVELSPRRS